jgi:cytochrome c oxidase cbb3-type subunit III
MTGEPDRDDKLLLDHEYDGIREYDNPMPRWWLATFWLTIVFSVLYVLNVPGIGPGKGRIAAYEAEMAQARALAAAHDPLAGVTAEAVLAAAADPATRAAGQATYAAMCASCHAADGGGLIGPNLADDHFLHGSGPLDAMRVIVEGVPAKGMPPWGRILKPDQLLAVAGYVASLRGTTPASPKAPEGDPAPPEPGSP